MHDLDGKALKSRVGKERDCRGLGSSNIIVEGLFLFNDFNS